MLRRNRFLTGEADDTPGAVRDICWLAPNAEPMTDEHWGDTNMRCFGMLLDGRAKVSAIPRPGTDASVLLVFNGWHEGVEFTLPTAPGGGDWVRLFDTALDPQLRDDFEAGEAYVVTGRSVLALVCAGAAALNEPIASLIGSAG